jgi:hypothetical protein
MPNGAELIEALLESAKHYGYVQRHPIDAQLTGLALERSSPGTGA